MYITTTEETYQDGEVIFEEGSHGDWIYVIESGSVEILKKVGDKNVVIEKLGAGEVFGELGYIAKVPRIATVKAVGQTTVGILDRGFLDAELNKLSGDFQAILKTLSLRLEKTTRVASETILRRQEQRSDKVLELQFKSKEEFLKAYSENISSSGIFMNTEEPLLQGEHFMLNLFLPDDPEALEIECEVSWNRTVTGDPVARPLGMGVKFVKISHDGLRKLKKNLS